MVKAVLCPTCSRLLGWYDIYQGHNFFCVGRCSWDEDSTRNQISMKVCTIHFKPNGTIFRPRLK